MKAIILEKIAPLTQGDNPLRAVELPDPIPADDEVLIRVHVCGVCHTELDEIEGRTLPPRLPIILGHQAVGTVISCGKNVTDGLIGERVGVAWIGGACGRCRQCISGFENLCSQFVATGRDRHGGYAELMTARSAYAVPIPAGLEDVNAAPLLCAGAIGYRSLLLANMNDGENLGLTGFGASAHLVLKMSKALMPNTRIFVFARSERERDFASKLGAAWVGDTAAEPPEKLNAVIDTTPAWTPVYHALRCLAPGGRLVINAIRKQENDKAVLLELSYEKQLWLEKEIKSVANVTRENVRQMLQLAAQIKLHPRVVEYPFDCANEALTELKFSPVEGAKVLRVRNS